MKFSTKTKYALSSMILLAQYEQTDTLKSLFSLSEELNISKIYLEQVFAQLKRHDLVISIKGAKGGYHLAKHSKEIPVLDILKATEISLFESEENTSNNIELTLSDSLFNPFDECIYSFLKSLTLFDLKEKYATLNITNSYMYYL